METAQGQSVGDLVWSPVRMPPNVGSFKPDQVISQADIKFTHGTSSFIFPQDVESKRRIARRSRFIPDQPSLLQAHLFANLLMKRRWEVLLQQFVGELQYYFRSRLKQIKYLLRKPTMNIMIAQLSYKIIAASRT